MADDIFPRARMVTFLPYLLIGYFGVHRFYVGKIGTGILMLVTFGGFGVWYVYDLILILFGSFRDKEGRRVFRWFEAGSV